MEGGNYIIADATALPSSGFKLGSRRGDEAVGFGIARVSASSRRRLQARLNFETTSSLSSYAQVTLTNQSVQVWTNSSTDTRALLIPGSSNRIASAWTTTNLQGSSFTIDLNLAAGHTNQIALYCVDWLGTGTVLEKIEVFDYGDTSHPLDTRSFQLPANGVYLAWKLSGHKVIRVTKPDANSATKAVVSALFIGAGS